MDVHSGFWSVFALAAGASIVALIDVFRARISLARGYREKLEEANTFLHVHEHALGEFMQFSEPAVRLKRALIDLSEQVSAERTAVSMIVRAGQLGAGVLEPSIEADELVQDLELLRSSRPGQARIFEQAVRCGLFAALYRWPSTEEALSKAFAYAVADQARQVDRALRAAKTRAPTFVDRHQSDELLESAFA